MPDEEKKKPLDKMVELDTSGPEVDVTIEEPKSEEVIETKEAGTKTSQMLEILCRYRRTFSLLLHKYLVCYM